MRVSERASERVNYFSRENSPLPNKSFLAPASPSSFVRRRRRRRRRRCRETRAREATAACVIRRAGRYLAEKVAERHCVLRELRGVYRSLARGVSDGFTRAG